MDQGSDQGKYWGAYGFFAFLFFGLLVLMAVFFHYGVSFGDYMKFLLGLLIFVFIPGQSLVWFSKIYVSRLENLTLSMALGMLAATLINKFSRMANAELVFTIWIILSACYFVFRLIKNPPGKRDFSFRITWVGILFLLIVLAFFSTLVMDNYRNGLQNQNGSFAFNMHYYDGFRQNAVVRELSHTVPPQMPWAAGIPLSYHYGMDMFISLFYKYFDIGVFDLNHRLAVTFFSILLLFTLFIFIKEFTSSKEVALFGTFLILFGSGGFSYAATYLLGAPGWGNTFHSFYFFNLICTNSLLPGLGVLFAGFFCLVKYIKTHRFSWLIFCGLFLAGILEYKMFFFGPVLGALFFSGIVFYVLRKDSALLKAGFVTTVIGGFLLISAYLNNQGGPQYEFQLRFVDWIVFVLSDLKLPFLFQPWIGLLRESEYVFSNFLLVLPIFIGYFLGSFGLSLISLPSVIKDFFSFRKVGQARFFLIIFFAGCVFFMFGVHVTLDRQPRDYTNVYVFALSIIALSLFWAECVIKFLAKRKKTLKIATLFLIVILSVPNTARFMWIKVKYPQSKIFDKSFIQASDWINENTEPESVFLSHLHIFHSCYFADRRTVLEYSPHSYLTWHLTTSQIKKRRNDIERFFQDPRLNGDVLREYNVSYVWAWNNIGFLGDIENHSSRIGSFSAIESDKAYKPQQNYSLELVFKNENYLVFKAQMLPMY
ncbi:hypothetical protein ACFLRM_01190 [Acidobacteriota bacterium]